MNIYYLTAKQKNYLISFHIESVFIHVTVEQYYKAKAGFGLGDGGCFDIMQYKFDPWKKWHQKAVEIEEKVGGSTRVGNIYRATDSSYIIKQTYINIINGTFDVNKKRIK